MTQPSPNFVENSAVLKNPAKYEIIEVDVAKIIKSWKKSLFSFEWLTPDGNIRTPEQLSESERQKYETVLKAYENQQELERPILGIGIMDNVEIGSRRDVLLTLSAQNVKKLEVHINKNDKNEFNAYL